MVLRGRKKSTTMKKLQQRKVKRSLRTKPKMRLSKKTKKNKKRSVVMKQKREKDRYSASSIFSIFQTFKSRCVEVSNKQFYI